MLTAEEGVDLLTYERTPTDERRWRDREQERPWQLKASRWLRGSLVDEPVSSEPGRVADEPVARLVTPADI